MTLRKWILKLHLYGGLLCFWYLIIFAISALQFQHHFKFMEPGNGKEINTEKAVNIQPVKDNLIFAHSLQNDLNIPGWIVNWQTSRDSSGIFHTSIQNPKAGYDLVYDPLASKVKIKSVSNGFWRIINSLHGNMGNIPNAPLLVFWKIYTYLVLLIVVFVIISGLWLWAGKSGNKTAGWLTFSGIMALSFILMLIVYING
jgi:hypothetical protein